MKKKIILLMVAAAFAIGTVGCGSDNDTPVKDKNITKEPIPNKKVDKPKPTEVKTFLGISQDQNTTVYFEHQGQGAMTLIYVDTDNDTSTGYQADDITKGSELLVVDLRNGSKPILSKIDDTNRSSWKDDVNNTDFNYKSGSKSDTIVFRNDLIEDNYFTVTAQVADKEWTSIDKYTQTKINDIKMADDNNPTVIKGDSNLSMEISNDNEYISIKLKGDGYLKNTQIFFDTDESNGTGYNIDLWKNFGADYMICTDGKLTKRLADKSDWDYGNSVTIPMIEKNNTINFSFKRSLLDNQDTTMRVGTVVSDNSWTVVHAIPEQNATTEAYEYTF